MKTYSEQFLRDEYERMLTDYDLNKSEFGFEDYLRNNNLGLELQKIKTAESEGAGMGTYMALGGVGLALAGMVGVNVLNNKLSGLQSNMYDMVLGNNPMDTIERTATVSNENTVLKSMFGEILGNVRTRINPDFKGLNNPNDAYLRELKQRELLSGNYPNPFFGMGIRDIGDIIGRNIPEGGVSLQEFQQMTEI